MNNFDIKLNLMKRACELSLISIEKGGGPFGCVITDSNYNILSESHNKVTLLNDPTAHAEIDTIRETCKKLNSYNLSDCKLFTSCEPCPMCLGAIYWSRINDVYYCNTRNDAKNIGFDDEFIYDELKKDNKDRTIKLIKIDNVPNGNESFTIWNNSTEKKHY
jgi:tRNA(Arg) A34 adenosine deaminase TadA